MDEIDQLDPETVAAMLAVVVDRVPADDAWVAYVRARHPDAADELARLAMTDVALELLVDRGHVSTSEASAQRHAASGNAAARVERGVWREIHRMKRMLEKLEAMEDSEWTRAPRLVVVDENVLELADSIAETEEETRIDHSRSA